MVYTHFAAIKRPSLILCTTPIGFGALENLPLLPPSTQVSISIALLGLAKNPTSLHHPLSAHDLFLPLFPKATGGLAMLGVQWSWESENEGKRGASGAWRSGIVPIWLLFLLFQALALQKHLNYYSSAVK